VTGDADDVGVVDVLLLVLTLSPSFVDELSVLIGVYEYQPDERKDLKKSRRKNIKTIKINKKK
jgi:hypothetical protein